MMMNRDRIGFWVRLVSILLAAIFLFYIVYFILTVVFGLVLRGFK